MPKIFITDKEYKADLKVAKVKDKNNIDCVMKIGNMSVENIIPIKIDLEKSGLGNKSNPANKPIIIDIYAFFSKNVFE